MLNRTTDSLSFFPHSLSLKKAKSKSDEENHNLTTNHSCFNIKKMLLHEMKCPPLPVKPECEHKCHAQGKGGG